MSKARLKSIGGAFAFAILLLAFFAITPYIDEKIMSLILQNNMDCRRDESPVGARFLGIHCYDAKSVENIDTIFISNNKSIHENVYAGFLVFFLDPWIYIFLVLYLMSKIPKLPGGKK